MLDANINELLAEHLIQIYSPQYLYLPVTLREQYPDFSAVYEGYDYVVLKTDFEKTYPLYSDLALLLTTSGSTGSPKLVRQSYENIQSNAEAIAQYLDIDETERPVTTLPMNYTYGLSIINSHILKGATILLTPESIISMNFWKFMKSEHATSFAGVPFTYDMLKKVRFFRMKLPDLRYLTQAGGKLPAEIHREFAEYALEKGI